MTEPKFDTASELREEFERQAEWGREKAIQYPHDRRNAVAAAHFDELAASVKDCPPEVLEAFYELFEAGNDSVEWLEMLRRAGLDQWPDTAEELCRNFIAARTG
jgi:hypothetical protein